MIDSKDDVLFTVNLPYANFGIVSKAHVIRDAAPIARWMVGKHVDEIRVWARRKGGFVLNIGLAMNRVGAEAAGAAGCFSIKTPVDIIQSAMKVGIVGSREYPELDRVETLVGLLHESSMLVSGGAEGVDKRATAAGLSTRRAVVELKPIGTDKGLWVKAAFARNEMIAQIVDVVVAFWDGHSNGTADTIRHAMRISGKCIVALPGQPPVVWVPTIS